ncbi:MAG: YIEGIA family protein [Vulcanibacillus sp.]
MLAVLLGVFVGFVNRLIMLKTDYRQYPTYKHGKLIHVALGFIAAGLGAIAVPALITEEYTAITFLALAAQQFRDVRTMERKTLTELDNLELVPRGTTYIEGIAMVFEGRNYLVIFSAFFTSLVTILTGWYFGILAGLISYFISKKFMAGSTINQIAEVYEGKVNFDGPHLYVDDIYIMNIGLETNIKLIKKNGMGIIVKPKGQNSTVTLSNLGQRQAILHNLSIILGVYRDAGEPALVPLSKIYLNDGRIGIFFLPQIKDIKKAIEITKLVPVLENAIRLPSKSDVNE